MHAIPDSPDALIRLWADTPPPQAERARKPRRVRLKPRTNRRPFGWPRLAKREGVPARLLWAAYARDQARTCLTRARVARAILPYCEHKRATWEQEAARKPEWQGAAVVARLAAESLEKMSSARAAHQREGLRWFRDRWLPDADARLREHGLA